MTCGTGHTPGPAPPPKSKLAVECSTHGIHGAPVGEQAHAGERVCSWTSIANLSPVRRAHKLRLASRVVSKCTPDAGPLP
eukprot:15450247-Alexandrium_andersonii.AAC.1